MRKAIMGVSLVLLAGVASAQVGGRAPAAAGDGGVEVPVGTPSGPEVPGLDGPQRTIVQDRAAPTVGTPPTAVDAAPRDVLVRSGFAGEIPARTRPRATARRPAAEIDVEVGVNRSFAIAKAHVNRIVTPFTDAKVVTTSAAGIRSEGGIVYVSTNADESIGLFIHEAADAENAISLTLVPEEIDQVSTRVHIRGLRAAATRPVQARRDVAQSFETASPYVDTLSGLVAELAHGRVPEGYGLQDVASAAITVPTCRLPGASAIPAQLITGSELFVVVYRVRANQGVVLDESACAPEARAVAAWPKRSLSMGEETEVYAVFTVQTSEGAVQVRPSVVGGAP